MNCLSLFGWILSFALLSLSSPLYSLVFPPSSSAYELYEVFSVSLAFT